MKIKTADVIGLAMVAVGVVMTVLLFVAMRRPSDIVSFTIDEAPPSNASPHNPRI